MQEVEEEDLKRGDELPEGERGQVGPRVVWGQSEEARLVGGRAGWQVHGRNLRPSPGGVHMNRVGRDSRRALIAQQQKSGLDGSLAPPVEGSNQLLRADQKTGVAWGAMSGSLPFARWKRPKPSDVPFAARTLNWSSTPASPRNVSPRTVTFVVVRLKWWPNVSRGKFWDWRWRAIDRCGQRRTP